MLRCLHRCDPPSAKVLVRWVYVNAVRLVNAPRPGSSRVSHAPDDLFIELGRTDFFSKKMLGEGIAGEQNVAGMWLKYGSIADKSAVLVRFEFVWGDATIC
jgi:hypothetical protein